MCTESDIRHAIAGLSDAKQRDKSPFITQLMACGGDAMPYLLRVLDGNAPRIDTKTYVMQAIVAVDRENGLQLLYDRLPHMMNPKLRKQVLDLFITHRYKLDDPGIFGMLCRYADDYDPMGKRAIELLIEMARDDAVFEEIVATTHQIASAGKNVTVLTTIILKSQHAESLSAFIELLTYFDLISYTTFSESLAPYGDQLTRQLQVALDGSNKKRCFNAAYLLYQLDAWTQEQEKIRDVFLEALDWQSETMQITIVDMLSKFKSPVVVDRLILVLEQSQSHNIRRTAAWSLGELQDERALQPLLRRANVEGDSLARQSVLRALGKFKNDTARQTLLNLLLNNKDTHSAYTIAKALIDIYQENIGDILVKVAHKNKSEALSYLISALRTSDVDASEVLKGLYSENPKLIREASRFLPKNEIKDALKNQDAYLKSMKVKTQSDLEARIKPYIEKAHSCPICGRKPEDLRWFYVSSPPRSWEMMAGRAGWLTICPDDEFHVEFFLVMMN